MTRINVIPVEELCDQHLLAEHRELTRIPNCISRGRYSLKGIPDQYVLGTGHVKFFYDKLSFLKERYRALCDEAAFRGFSVQDRWPELDCPELFNAYLPTEEAMALNRSRIAERMRGFSPRHTRRNPA